MSRNIAFNPDLTADSPPGFKYDTQNPNFSGSDGGSSYQNKNQPPPYSAMPPPPVRLPPIQQTNAQGPASNRNQYNPNASVASGAGGPNAQFNDGIDGWGQIGATGGLSDKVVRIRFIRKVYIIVTALLLFTFGVVAVFVFAKPVNDFAKTSAGLGLYITSVVLFVILIIIFAFCSCTNGLRKVPFNYMILFAIALTMAIMLGFISAYHSIQAVIIAVGITFLITGGVTAFAMQTRFDFTQHCWLVAICLSFALIGFGIACIFVRNNILQAVYGGLGAVVMAIFLAIDTQMIVGGKRFQYSEEDYINAALQLYLDICYIFMYILQMFGNNK